MVTAFRVKKGRRKARSKFEVIPTLNYSMGIGVGLPDLDRCFKDTDQVSMHTICVDDDVAVYDWYCSRLDWSDGPWESILVRRLAGTSRLTSISRDKKYFALNLTRR